MLIETTKHLGVLADLNSAFEGDSEKEQKKAFERSKKIQSALPISTYESAVQAYKSRAAFPLSDLYSVVRGRCCGRQGRTEQPEIKGNLPR